MRKIKLYVLMSLDGYIARPDGELDWFTTLPNPEKTDYDYKAFIDSIDTVIIGDDIFDIAAEMPYANKETYVACTKKMNIEIKENIRILAGNMIRKISSLKEKQGNDIWVVGGNKLISKLLSSNLIDEMQVCYIPVVLGEGMPLFSNKLKESKWELIRSKVFDSGVLKADYQLKAE